MGLFLGIDIGKKGGIAQLDSEGKAAAWRMPEDAMEVAKLIRKLLADQVALGRRIDLVCVERVGAMPKQGVKSMFTFGTGYGVILGALAALDIPHMLVTPRQWQKEMLDAGTGETKERSLNMARRLFPAVDLRFKSDDGKADALHMARYAMKYFMENGHV